MTKGGGKGKGRPRKVIPTLAAISPVSIEVGECSMAAKSKKQGSVCTGEKPIDLGIFYGSC